MKLTKVIRAQVKSAMVKYAYDGRVAEAARLVGALLHERLYDAQRAALPKFLIDDRWIETSASAAVYAYDNATHRDRIDYDCFELPAKIPVRQGEQGWMSTKVDVYREGDDSALSTAYFTWRTLVAERASLRGRLESVLAACSTDTKLFELLPEAKDFMPDALEGGRELVPIATIDAIRVLFAK